MIILRRISFTFTLFILLLLTSSFIVSIRGENVERSSSFTTSKGTIININATIENAGTVNNKPTFVVNSTYTLTIIIGVAELGADVIDFHDIALSISITSKSIIGIGDVSWYQGYFFDSETRLEDDSSHTYNIEMFIAGGSVEKDATLKVKLGGKENVDDNRDPSSDFDAISMECTINPNETVHNYDDFSDSTEILNRSLEVFAEKETKLKFEFFMNYDGQANDSARPEISSNMAYLMSFTTTVISLGTDANDFHDINIRARLEDSSLTDIVPGNEATQYYAAGIDDEDTKLVVGDSVTHHLVLYPSTNINNSEVKLILDFSGKEAVDISLSNPIDPTSEFGLSIEFVINEGLSNFFDDIKTETDGLKFQFIPIFFFLIGIPIILRKKR